jgi:5-methylcytosine-specific restriction endonuclease McrA
MKRNHKLTLGQREFLRGLKGDIDFPVQCFYCNKWLTKHTHTFDHKVPLSKGGARYGQNLASCCEPCNTAKGDMSVEEFRKKLAAALTIEKKPTL